MEFSWLLCNQHWTVSLNLLKMLPDNRIVQNVTPMYNIDGMKLLILIHLKPIIMQIIVHIIAPDLLWNRKQIIISS